MTPARPFLLPILVLALAAPLAAGVVYEIETTDHGASPPHKGTTTISVEPPLLKLEARYAEARRNATVLFDGDELLIVDDRNRAVVPFDRESLDRLAAMMRQIQARFQDLPPEVLEQMEAAGRLPPGAGAAAERQPIEWREAGVGEVAGYPCVRYVGRRGARRWEVQSIPWDAIPGGDEASATLVALSEFFREMIASVNDLLGQMGDGGGIPLGPEDLFAETAFDRGFPGVVKTFDGDTLDSESTLRSATRRTLDPAEFEPPAGYKRRSMIPQ